MKFSLTSCLLACVLLMPVSFTVAQNTAGDAVSKALAEGKSPAAVIEMMMAEPLNLSLEEATLSALDAGGEGNQSAFASAGIAAANNLVEAEAVASAVKAAGVDPTIVDAAMAQYVKLMDQPYIHHDAADPTGGGAYNPQGPGQGPGGIVGGTRPPVGGTRPPVSPSS